jgi:two-component system alkaline phosphatase synthesis response regulator PhoP
MARILLADDNLEIAKMMRDALEDGGHEVRCVHDGCQALKIAMNEDFDFYVLDVRMPMLDGYSLTLSIKRKFPGRRVLLVTGLDPKKYEVMANAAGADATLQKPFAMPDMIDLVNGLLP